MLVLIIFGIMILVAIIFGCILNPLFWQSFRNAKFLDKKDKHISTNEEFGNDKE